MPQTSQCSKSHGFPKDNLLPNESNWLELERFDSRGSSWYAMTCKNERTTERRRWGLHLTSLSHEYRWGDCDSKFLGSPAPGPESLLPDWSALLSVPSMPSPGKESWIERSSQAGEAVNALAGGQLHSLGPKAVLSKLLVLLKWTLGTTY